jgi:hypothetical protein
MRSDLPILSTACGDTRSGEDDIALPDMMLCIIDTISVSQDIQLGLQTQGYKPGYGNV